MNRLPKLDDTNEECFQNKTKYHNRLKIKKRESMRKNLIIAIYQMIIFPGQCYIFVISHYCERKLYKLDDSIEIALTKLSNDSKNPY